LTSDHQGRVRELFDAALDQPPMLRQQFLADACQGDPRLLETVGRLLSARERSQGVLDTPVRQRREAAASLRPPGSFIGPYRILQKLSVGGMGVVYQSIRADEVFRRICAIKVIRADLSAGWLRERFHQERKILARLDHVNIARIVDGGTTEDGLPYFVMDYVDGPAIHQFCTDHGLGIRARLTLFQQVCAAVDYLHRNRVIHGDLKPPNILVGNDGTVKLVDFGIASALFDREGRWQTSSIPLMTLGYASPEQMQNQPLTPASDIYSLGVILYELLTGAQPYPAGNRTSAEILKAIATQDPLPPSVALRSRSRKPDAQRPDYKISTDLDCVILRAMHRDREARYASAAALHADLVNCLEQRPVEAHQPSLGYRTGKFLVRRRRAVIWACAVALLLAIAGWQVWYVRQRYEFALQKEIALRLKVQKDYDTLKRAYEIKNSAGGDAHASSPLLKQLEDTELVGVKNLTEAYRNSFSEAVRVWPGMTHSRQELLDQSGRYLQEVEHFVGEDPRAPEQLAGAWLWLANVEGNPKTVNLKDRVRARYSIGQAQRLIDQSTAVSRALVDQVRLAVSQIEPESHHP
jgi:eukaryotic-like serine/threonine-protein kinase